MEKITERGNLFSTPFTNRFLNTRPGVARIIQRDLIIQFTVIEPRQVGIL